MQCLAEMGIFDLRSRDIVPFALEDLKFVLTARGELSVAPHGTVQLLQLLAKNWDTHLMVRSPP